MSGKCAAAVVVAFAFGILLGSNVRIYIGGGAAGVSIGNQSGWHCGFEVKGSPGPFCLDDVPSEGERGWDCHTMGNGVCGR